MGGHRDCVQAVPRKGPPSHRSQPQPRLRSGRRRQQHSCTSQPKPSFYRRRFRCDFNFISQSHQGRLIFLGLGICPHLTNSYSLFGVFVFLEKLIEKCFLGFP
ncbi:Pre-mRNA-splicing factor like [Actinidia chinensis var. chinensis]|uniref:Pre-mRNA-splicing factor like n=1 Tax=Actinidia chinensis var. chinensis TaxID=1590841 RepID=A0A2R6PY72_ACTCC|nr:Pre-mRNA-splicing factor like [Actinidia chinensis var. chinensis]